MKNGRFFAMAWNISLLVMMLGGCGTSDGTLREQGRNESYIMGFHDGRHSGMKEAGNYLEHIVKDTQRFKDDAEYHVTVRLPFYHSHLIEEFVNTSLH